MLSGHLFKGFGFALSFLLRDFWPLVIVTVVFTLGEIINVPSSQTMRADMMNPEQIGAIRVRLLQHVQWAILSLV